MFEMTADQEKENLRYQEFYDRLYPKLTPEYLGIDHEIEEYDYGQIEDLKEKYIEKYWNLYEQETNEEVRDD